MDDGANSSRSEESESYETGVNEALLTNSESLQLNERSFVQEFSPPNSQTQVKVPVKSSLRRTSTSTSNQILTEEVETNEYCISSCEFNRKEGGKMIECSLCGQWYHYNCVGISGRINANVFWSCKSCRELPKQITIIKSQLDLVLNLVNNKNQRINDLNTKLDCVLRYCEKLESENVSLREKLTKPTHRSQPKSLIIGDSTIKEISSKNAKASEVVSISGAKVQDISDKLELLAIEKTELSDVTIHVGTNDISDGTDMEHIITSMNQSVEVAKKLTSNVYVSSVLPRLDEANNNKALELNAEIQKMCTLIDVKYIDHDMAFKYADGSMDPALFHDNVHPTRKGAAKVAKNLSNHNTNVELQVRENPRHTHNPNNAFGRRNFRIGHQPHAKVQRNPTTSNTICWYCQEPGHTKAVCRHKQPVKCHKCDRYGHKAKFCKV